MSSFNDRGVGPTAPIILAIAAIFAAPVSAAPPPAALTLEAAQRLARERDAGREALESESASMREMAVAAGQLPDPEARLGAVNLPTDSFALDREPMTMLEVGVMQRFPAGNSRKLSRTALESRASVTDAAAADRARLATLEVERAWRELDYLEESLALLAAERRWVDTLVAGTSAAYAAGEGSQTGLLGVRLMALEIEERVIDAERERGLGLAALSRWIGDAANADRVPAGRPPASVEPLGMLLEGVERHPRLAGLDREREAAEVEVELAGERYKPAFGVDVAYGFRRGRMAEGGSAPDMLTAMLTFDVPLFTRNRQDRDASAARARARAASSRRADELRVMQAELRAEHARAMRLAELIGLYETRVTGLAGLSVDSALAEYRASDGSLDGIVETQRRLLDVRDRLAKARREYALALAQIAYLAGDPS